MDELIRKSDAIDALFEWYETPMDQDAVDVICNVPPADEYEIIKEYCNSRYLTLIDSGYLQCLNNGIIVPYKQQWIPCSERLPEDEDYHDFWGTPDGAVIWCREDGEIGIGWFYQSTKEWADLFDNPVGKVVAWRPLPESWKGSEG